MRSLIWIAASLVSTVVSLPTARSTSESSESAPVPHLFDWSPDLARYYSAVGKHISDSRGSPFNPVCDLSNTEMPDSELNPPEEGLRLLDVVIGRGTQVSYMSYDNLVHI
jgi:hypothetical protein